MSGKQQKIKKTGLPGGGVMYEEETAYTGTETEIELMKEQDRILKEMGKLEDVRDKAMAKALDVFERERQFYANQIRQTAGESEAQRFLDRVTTPDLLESIKALMPMSSEMFKQAGREHELSGGDGGEPPGGSVVSLNPPRTNPPGQYESYAQMVDDIRTKAYAGDKQALADYKAMWDKAAQTLKKMMESGKPFPTLSGCPKCGRGIVEADLKNDRCPFCGVNIRDFRRSGGDIF